MFRTIKAKLIASFIFITLLISVSAIFSVTKIQQSADGFAEYRQMARAAVQLGRVQASMLNVRINVKDYLNNPVQKEIDEYTVFYDKNGKFVKEAMGMLEKPEYLDILRKIETERVNYNSAFKKVQKYMAQRHYLVNEKLNTMGPEMERLLTTIMRSETELQNYEAQNESSETLRSLLLARLYGAKFIKSNAKTDMDRVLNEFDDVYQELRQLKLHTSPENLTLMDELSGMVESYTASIKELGSVITARNDVIENELNKQGRSVANLSKDLKLKLKKVQDRIGPEVQANNENTILTSFISTTLVVLLAIIIAIVIPRLIGRGLSAIQDTMQKISETGDFKIRADDARKDEIGIMGAAINNLLTDIEKAIDEANNVVAAISSGDFDQRVQSNLNGDLDRLKTGINNSADTINTTMSQLGQAMTQMSKGNFNAQIDSAGISGEFLHMIESTRTTMEVLNATIGDIVNIMDCMENGDFSQRVTVEASGDLLRLKEGVNNSMDSIQSAMVDITRIVVAQSEGDLTQCIKAEYHGQLDKLKQAVNTSSQKLVEVVSKALESTSIVGTAAEEVARGATDLSTRVQEQAAALEETSATMDEMNSAVQGNTDNAQEASQVAEEVQEKAHRGVEVMSQTIDAMGSIQQSSHKISDIVTLIDGIAFQTNLLALNAAVEAARAGDHGRGFAVVAGEVRALAQKSAEAAKDIKQLIDESVTRIDDGTRLASESGSVLTDINSSIETVAEMINQIAEASKEQAKGVSQVHQAISQIDDVTQQNAALVEETSAAAESLNDQSDNLRKEMAFFNTGTAMNAPQIPKAHLPSSNTVTKPSESASQNRSALEFDKATKAKPIQAKEPLSKPTAKDSDDEWEDF